MKGEVLVIDTDVILHSPSTTGVGNLIVGSFPQHQSLRVGNRECNTEKACGSRANGRRDERSNHHAAGSNRTRCTATILLKVCCDFFAFSGLRLLRYGISCWEAVRYRTRRGLVYCRRASYEATVGQLTR
jgi:hypothetical protein